MLKQRIEQDLKDAMLGGDKQRVSTLRVIKSAILYEEIAKRVRDSGLSDDEITSVLSKEAKKRQESAELYKEAGDANRAEAELAEKSIIDAYLPEQISDEDLKALVGEAVRTLDASSVKDMGHVIGWVKERTGDSADGARIARQAKEELSEK